MKPKTLSPLVLLAASLALAQKAEPETYVAKVADLLKDGAKYDKKVVVVTGKVDDFKAKTSKAGNDYFTFTLLDGKDEAHVYGFGKLSPEPKDGDKVKVTGKFRISKVLKGGEVKNEIDVSAPKGAGKTDAPSGAKPGVEFLK